MITAQLVDCNSAVAAPASASFKTPMICSSVNLLPRMRSSCCFPGGFPEWIEEGLLVPVFYWNEKEDPEYIRQLGVVETFQEPQ